MNRAIIQRLFDPAREMAPPLSVVIYDIEGSLSYGELPDEPGRWVVGFAVEGDAECGLSMLKPVARERAVIRKVAWSEIVDHCKVHGHTGLLLYLREGAELVPTKHFARGVDNDTEGW